MPKQPTKQPDEPDIRIEKSEPYLAPDLHIEWEMGNDNTYTVRIHGEHTVKVTEEGGGDGLIYSSPAFKGKRGSLKDALRTAAVNSLNASFAEQWRRTYPPKKANEQDLANENEILRKKIEEMMALINQGGEGNAVPKAS